jgi:hypothetical protein
VTSREGNFSAAGLSASAMKRFVKRNVIELKILVSTLCLLLIELTSENVAPRSALLSISLALFSC